MLQCKKPATAKAMAGGDEIVRALSEPGCRDALGQRYIELDTAIRSVRARCIYRSLRKLRHRVGWIGGAGVKDRSADVDFHVECRSRQPQTIGTVKPKVRQGCQRTCFPTVCWADPHLCPEFKLI